MDCKRVDEALVGFHLAALDGPTRAQVEAHLCVCPACVASYLMLKRAIDAGEESPAPPMALRERVAQAARLELGANVVQLVRPAPTRARRVAFAAAAAALLLAAPLAFILGRAGAPATTAQSNGATSPPSHELQVVPVSTTPPASSVDTARAVAENLQFL